LASLGGLRLVAETLDRFFEDAALDGIVVDDQNKLGHETGTLRNTRLRLAGRHRGPWPHGPQTGQECPRAVNASRHFGFSWPVFAPCERSMRNRCGHHRATAISRIGTSRTRREAGHKREHEMTDAILRATAGAAPSARASRDLGAMPTW